jgi:transcriptional regulator with XRE-family HTH domain
MTTTNTSRRKQLGNEIRHARKKAGMTQAQVALALDCTQGKVNKIETGAVNIKLGDVRAMIDTFKLTGGEAEALIELTRAQSAQRGQWSGYRALIPHWFRTFTDLESTATEIMAWHGERIPDILQSEHYMLKQLSEADSTDITSSVRNRMDRRSVFDQDPAPYYRFIFGEAALLRAPGGSAPAVMVDQIEHMLMLSERHPRVYLHMLPFDAQLPAICNEFSIMRFAGRNTDFAYIEHVAGGQYFEDVKDFQLFVDAWDQLRGAALERRETERYLKELASSYRGQVKQMIYG